MNSTRFKVVGVLAIIIGLFQLYQAVYDRPAGSGPSTLGLVTGAIFLVLGVWYSIRGLRKT